MKSDKNMHAPPSCHQMRSEWIHDKTHYNKFKKIPNLFTWRKIRSRLGQMCVIAFLVYLVCTGTAYRLTKAQEVSRRSQLHLRPSIDVESDLDFFTEWTPQNLRTMDEKERSNEAHKNGRVLITPSLVMQWPLYESSVMNHMSLSENSGWMARERRQSSNNEQPDLVKPIDEPLDYDSGSGYGIEPVMPSAPFLESVSIESSLMPTLTILESPASVSVELSSTSNNNTPASEISNNINKAPVLNKRLPKLSATAGRFWSYAIPADTFFDEDGTTRKLRLTLVSDATLDSDTRLQSQLDNGISRSDVASETPGEPQFESWIQLDSEAQILYAFPSERDIGRHELSLVVGDRYGLVTSAPFELDVRQHATYRAHTHHFRLERLVWNQYAFASQIDALGTISRRLTVGVFGDPPNDPYKNFMFYSLERQPHDANMPRPLTQPAAGSTDQTRLVAVNALDNAWTYTLVWSNDSLPVHPCPRESIENLMRRLANVGDDWSLTAMGGQRHLRPSDSLLRALAPEFTLGDVSVELTAACASFASDGLERDANYVVDDTSAAPQLRQRLGRLTWHIGDLIEYTIAAETFSAPRTSGDARDLHLSLLTIDGAPAERHPIVSQFLAFDERAQLIYGVATSTTMHAGAWELILVARDPATNQRAHDVFVLELLSRPATEESSYTFQVALYLVPRTGALTLADKLLVAHRTLNALVAPATQDRQVAIGTATGEPNGQQDFVVLDVQKFATASSNRSAWMCKTARRTSSSLEVIQIETHLNELDEHVPQRTASIESNYFYKFIWTNVSLASSVSECPMDAIRTNVLDRLARPISVAVSPNSDGSAESARWNAFDALRRFYEPELELVHAVFEPMGVCSDHHAPLELGPRVAFLDSALPVLDNQTADPTLTAYDTVPLLGLDSVQLAVSNGESTQLNLNNQVSDTDYVAIVGMVLVVLLTLVMLTITVIISVLAYKMNADKRRRAASMHASLVRQNSLYLAQPTSVSQAAFQVQMSPHKSGHTNLVSNGVFAHSHYTFETDSPSHKPVVQLERRGTFCADLSAANAPDRSAFNNNTWRGAPRSSTLVFPTGSMMHTMTPTRQPYYTLGSPARQQQPPTLMIAQPQQLINNYTNLRLVMSAASTPSSASDAMRSGVSQRVSLTPNSTSDRFVTTPGPQLVATPGHTQVHPSGPIKRDSLNPSVSSSQSVILKNPLYMSNGPVPVQHQ